MPLSEKARIEVYLPEAAHPAYSQFLETLEREFTFAFGGCTLVRGLEGSYLSRLGIEIHDHISLLYSDAPFEFTHNFEILSKYTDELRDAALKALAEELILVAAFPVFHAQEASLFQGKATISPVPPQ